MSGKKFLALQRELGPRPLVNTVATRFMLNQALALSFGNGLGRVARQRLSGLRGIRSDVHSRKCDHPDREVFVVADVAPLLFPDNPDAQRQLIDIAWADYAKECDREAIKAYTNSGATAPSSTPLAQPA